MHEWVRRREHKPEVVSPTATLEAINTQLREELRHERERAAAVQRQQGEQLAGTQQQLCDLTSRLHRSRQPEPRHGNTSRRRQASIKHRGKPTRRYATDSTTQTCTSNEDSGISDSTSESSIDIPSKYVQAVNNAPCDGESYYVWGEVSREAPKALFVIDTGAQVSIINKKLYDSIPAYDKPELKKTEGQLTTIVKNPVRTYGIAVDHTVQVMV